MESESRASGKEKVEQGICHPLRSPVFFFQREVVATAVYCENPCSRNERNYFGSASIRDRFVCGALEIGLDRLETSGLLGVLT